MKKLIIGCSLFCFIAVQASAQTQTFAKGDNVIGIGVGIGGNLYTGYGWASGFKRTPPITVSYENCILGSLWDDRSSLGIGGMLGYASAKYGHATWGWKSTDIIIGVRGSLHYALVDKLDTYVAAFMGYDFRTWKWNDGSYSGSYNAGASGFTSFWNVGARYYFTDQVAVFSELGYGFAILNFGLSLKF